MDSIKTHCYATFDGKEAAERAMKALQGLQWPPQSFKRLEAKMGDMSAEEVSIVFARSFRSPADSVRKRFRRMCRCAGFWQTKALRKTARNERKHKSMLYVAIFSLYKPVTSCCLFDAQRSLLVLTSF